MINALDFVIINNCIVLFLLKMKEKYEKNVYTCFIFRGARYIYYIQIQIKIKFKLQVSIDPVVK